MKISKRIRLYATALIALFVFDIVQPTLSFALTSGPAQPEFSSFEPVSTTNLVNDFSGGLVYNIPLIEIPGPDGSSFPLGLSYHSGTTPEEEASWVGYGWTLNPGAVNRQKSGVPDDWNGQTLTTYNKKPANWTATVGTNISPELFTTGFENIIDIGAEAGGSLRYNNYKGFSYGSTFGISASLFNGLANLGYRVNDGSGSFSLSVNPAQFFAATLSNAAEKTEKDIASISAEEDDPESDKAERLAAAQEKMKKQTNGSKAANYVSYFTTFTPGAKFGKVSFIPPGYNGKSFKLLTGMSLNPVGIPVGLEVSAYGTFNSQKTKPLVSASSFGLLYSNDAENSDIMDYSIERNSLFTFRDKFTSIPYTSSDRFSIVGEGMAGAFQFYPREVGRFSPRVETSNSIFVDLGIEMDAGLNNGGGFQATVSNQSMSVGPWNGGSGNSGFPDIDSDKYAYIPLTDGDMGLSFGYGTDSPRRASINANSESTVFDDSEIENEIDIIDVRKRKMFIGYSLNKEFELEANNLSTGANYKVESKSEYTSGSSSIPRNASTLENQIGEFYGYGVDGSTYKYGLPVYTGGEQSISYDKDGAEFDLNSDSEGAPTFAYKNTESSNEKTVIGTSNSSAYASSYLITEITSPNYVDINMDGPDSDDFGGWTKFSYDRKHGGFNANGEIDYDNWYKYRFPYYGLRYSRNSYSDPNDDLLGKQLGYKEMYYLDKIETKTHILEFDKIEREDGREANHDEGLASYPNNPDNSDNAGIHKMEQLESIRLYKKGIGNESPVLIKTVFFEYYENGAFPNAPNVSNGGGKLLLKKVWFEYNQVKKARISPYTFSYEYPHSTANPYAAPFAGLSVSSDLQQTPDYNPFMTDAWGNYQANGPQRNRHDKHWLDQNPDLNVFDPAAWQLKQIGLPSGGEIHVQYEQKDYTYVQNERAHYLHSLGNLENGGSVNVENGFQLNYDSPEDAQLARALIEHLYISEAGPKEKMYFKFLFALRGSEMPNFDNCDVEYIDGYARVLAVSQTAHVLTLTLSENGHSLPKDVCIDFVKTQRRGVINSNCEIDESDEPDPEDKIMNLLGSLTGITQIFNALSSRCGAIDPGLSYLRVPTLYGKKGSGVRVSRLIRTDNSLDNTLTASNDKYEVLFGQEFSYEIEDPLTGKMVSSGVAENEPITIREENILVKPLDFFEPQGWFDRVISGKDKRKLEGPIGESAMPGASVGHARVVINDINISSSTTGLGTVLKEYYTAKDYPFEVDYTPIKVVDESTNMFSFFSKQLVFASQGFTFKVNDFHGKPKSVVNFAEKCDASADDVITSAEYFFYHEKGSSVPTSGTFSGDFNSSTKQLGKSSQLTIATSSSQEISSSVPFNFDATLGVFFIAALPFFFATVTGNEDIAMGSVHTSSKIVSEYAVPSKSITYSNGVYHVKENLNYDEITGDPIAVRNYDGFQNNLTQGEFLDLMELQMHKGYYTNYTIPAHMAFFEMGNKSYNEGLISSGFTKIVNSSGDYLTMDSNGRRQYCSWSDFFRPGDLIEIVNSNAPGELYHVDQFSSYFNQGDEGISGQNNLKLHRLSFVDYSNISTEEQDVVIRIVRSGATNQLADRAGSITTYGGSSSGGLNFADLYPIKFANRVNFLENLAGGQQPTAGDPGPFVLTDESVDPTLEFEGLNGECFTGFDMLEYEIETIFTDPYSDGEGFEVWRINCSEDGPLSEDDPHQTHGMRAYLNDIFNIFLYTDLSKMANGITCNKNSASFPQDHTTIGDPEGISFVKSLEDYLSAKTFAGVNGMNGVKLSDLFTIDIIENQEVRTIVDGGKNKLIQIKLIQKSNGAEYGVWWDCAAGEICTGCSGTSSYSVCDRYNGRNQIGQFKIDLRGELYFEDPSGKACNTGIMLTKPNFNVTCDCAEESAGQRHAFGDLIVDPVDGLIKYPYPDCNNYVALECIQFCNENIGIEKVVAHDMNTFSDDWNYNFTNSFLPDHNPYEKGERGKWRQKGAYVYNSNNVAGLSGTGDEGQYSFNSGTYTLPHFYHRSELNGDSDWKKATDVISYSKHGMAQEEENILGIKSFAKYGYFGDLVYFLGQNSDSKSSIFESFENNYGGELEDHISLPASGNIVSTAQHTGSKAYQILNSGPWSWTLNENYVLSDEILSDGLVSQFWFKTTELAKLNESANRFKLSFNGVQETVDVPFEIEARAGEWILLQCTVNPEFLSQYEAGNEVDMRLTYSFSGQGDEEIFMDDFRVQPQFSETMAYVYDPKNYRVLATLDDQNFALIYQYNTEGKLIRKIKETERGNKIISEGHYNAGNKTLR